MEVQMKKFRVIWPAVIIVLAGACKSGPGPVPPPPPAAWSVGLAMDSLTPASPLYRSPTWAFYIIFFGGTSPSGLLDRGTLGRDSVGRFARCLGPAGQFLGHSEVAYVALGDTASSDSAAYWRNVNRLAQGGEAMRVLLVSLSRGDSQSVMPGLVVLATPSFVPTVAAANGRGDTPDKAILRHWVWRNGGQTFAEDTTHASLVACGLS
jgi:hypothetical protein